MNKFQEALDSIIDYLTIDVYVEPGVIYPQNEREDECNILQELIDKYSKLEDLFNNKCSDGEMVVKDLMIKLEHLEKALDKICEDYVDNYYCKRLREGKERPTQEEYDRMKNIVKKRYLEESEKQ